MDTLQGPRTLPQPRRFTAAPPREQALFVPAALLQPPFLAAPPREEGARAAGLAPADFGALGGLLGHEMTHGFDNVGRLFTPDLVIKSESTPDLAMKRESRAKRSGPPSPPVREAEVRVRDRFVRIREAEMWWPTPAARGRGRRGDCWAAARLG